MIGEGNENDINNLAGAYTARLTDDIRETFDELADDVLTIVGEVVPLTDEQRAEIRRRIA